MSDYITIAIIAVLIIFILGRRLIGARKGTTYSVRSIFTRPIIYIALSAILLIGLQLWQIGIIVVAVLLGLFIGQILGKRSNIFEKDGKILYKRSNEVTVIWIIAYVIRIAIDFIANPALLAAISNPSSSTGSIISAALAVNQGNPLVLTADIILALSAGLLFGEALVLYRNFNSKYKNKK